jgi:hypothetical protein
VGGAAQFPHAMLETKRAFLILSRVAVLSYCASAVTAPPTPYWANQQSPIARTKITVAVFRQTVECDPHVNAILKVPLMHALAAQTSRGIRQELFTN